MEKLQAKLKALAMEISSDLSQMESAQGKALLSDFVSELFLNMAKQDQQVHRRQRQAEGIAAAKARGVRFGPERQTLPRGFEPMARLWHEGGISASSAAGELGMSRDTFLRRARERYADNRQVSDPA